MQNVSEEYREQINNTIRNRGHIHVTLEIVNQKAQNNATVINGENTLAYFSTPTADDLFHDDIDPQYYATDELDFTKVDGSMFFLPAQGASVSFYENGIVPNNFDSGVKITFGAWSELDIKGITIDFGEYYPTELKVITNGGEWLYTNDSSHFVTHDIYRNVSYVSIIPLAMLHGSRRMRIMGLKFGIENEFYDSKVINFDNADFISPIGDSVPSRDMNLTIDNRDLEYTPDNPESNIAFLEVGQKVRVRFGYDLDQQGNETEWLDDEEVAFLSKWNANTSTASFTATDKYNVLASTTYYRGKYRGNGISLYDLAVDVLTDAGLGDSRDYNIDDSLRTIIVSNPIPAVKHSEALQMIANAARCTLSMSRKGKVQIEKAYTPELPDWTATSNGEARYGNLAEIIRYGFEPRVQDKYYVSSARYVVKETGFDLIVPEGYEVDGTTLIADSISGAYVDEKTFVVPNGSIAGGETIREWIPEMPVISLIPESVVSLYHMTLKFVNTYPKRIRLCAYDENDELIKAVEHNVYGLSFTATDGFLNFSRLDIEFLEGADNERVVISDIIIEDIYGFTVDSSGMKQSPTATLQNKLASVSAVRTMFQTSSEQKELNKGNIVVSPSNTVFTIYFTEPSYGYSVTASGATATITDSSDYFVELTFSGMSGEVNVEYSVMGYQYQISYLNEKRVFAKNGDEIVWSNPLISSSPHAKELAEWVGEYYNDNILYDVQWRGDPRLDANDIISMETVMKDIVLAKLSRNSLSYNGAWSGSFQARKVVM